MTWVPHVRDVMKAGSVAILIGCLSAWQLSTPYWSFSGSDGTCKLEYDGWIWNLKAVGFTDIDLGPNLNFTRNFPVAITGPNLFDGYPKRVFIGRRSYWIGDDILGVPSLVESEDDEFGSKLSETTMISFLRILRHNPVIKVRYFDYGKDQVNTHEIEFEAKEMDVQLNEFISCLGYG
mgnify:CR=1 FL=1